MSVGIIKQAFRPLALEYDRQMIVHPALFGFQVGVAEGEREKRESGERDERVGMERQTKGEAFQRGRGTPCRKCRRTFLTCKLLSAFLLSLPALSACLPSPCPLSLSGPVAGPAARRGALPAPDVCGLPGRGAEAHLQGAPSPSYAPLKSVIYVRASEP